jgi:tRNA threonylcarbamoyladenosine biosynthesis protein TsaB
MLTLILDSSAGLATAILAEDEELVAAYSVRGSTLALLHNGIAHVQSDSGRPLSALDQIALVQGPGSWTGLHNCLTTAKTMAQVLDIPVLPISMLDVFAFGFTIHDGPLCAIIDAKHGAVYSSVYECRDGEVEITSAGKKRTIDELTTELQTHHGPLLLVGEAARTYENAISTGLGRRVAVSSMRYPPPEAFTSLVGGRQKHALTGDSRFGLAPDYMQEDFTAVLPRSEVTR